MKESGLNDQLVAYLFGPLASTPFEESGLNDQLVAYLFGPLASTPYEESGLKRMAKVYDQRDS